MMKLPGSRCVFVSVLIIGAGFLYLAEVAEGANEFRRCYNTSVEMHCFDAQFDSTYNRWFYTSFDSARQRCNKINSTLLVIRDEATNNFVQNYMSDQSNPISNQYVWMDAYRVDDYSNSYVWHWLNPKLPTLADPEVGYWTWIRGSTYYTTTLECRNESGKPPLQFYLTAKLPQDTYSYLCEYSGSRCSMNTSNALQLSDRCYISFSASVSWYEARNRCLKDGGDLASFPNVTSINFTSWLGSDPNVRFWIGLRFSWYNWKDSGEDVQFTNWASIRAWNLPCMIVWSGFDPRYSWSSKDCNTGDNVYVVCHSVTPLPTTTLTTTSTTAVPVTTSVDFKTQIETTQSNNPETNLSQVEKRSGSQPIGVAVGVGVGVGVPVIVAIIVIVICVVRKHKSKTHESTTTRQESRDESSHTEYQNNNGDDSEVNHYAIVHPSSPPKMVEQEPSSEPQYAILGFSESADRKSDIGHFPLNVL